MSRTVLNQNALAGRSLGWKSALGLALGLVPHVTAQSRPDIAEPRDEVFQQDVAWSPDGEWIAFSEYDGGQDYKPERWAIHLIRVNGADRRVLVANAQFVTWSGDGKRLAFGSKRDGNAEIYTISRDGSDMRRITNNDVNDNHPAWSPKGNKIAFSSKRVGNTDIYVMSVDGSDVTRVTTDAASDYNPSWSRDGTQLVFFREKGDRKDQIYVIRADGTEEQRVTRDDFLNTFPSFLTDGRVAYSCMESESSKKFVVTHASGENMKVLDNVPGFFARWSPDGKRVAFIAGRWPKSAIYLMNADGTHINKLVN